MTTVVYTDGACLGNPGPGGWAWAVHDGPYASGAEARSTNQRMEVNAALEALRSIEGPLEVVSDSTYVVNCFSDRWWEGWLARGWLNKAKKPVANRDLWEPLIEAYRADPQRVRFTWVKGHSDDPMNDLVDRLAVEAAQKQVGRSGIGVPVDLGPADAVGRPAEDHRVPAGHRLVVAGMRPPELGGYDDNPVAQRVRAQLSEILAAKRAMHDDLVVLTGLGLGAEQLGAEAAAGAGVPYVAVLPYPDPDAVWPAASRAHFAELLAGARDQVLLQLRRPETKQAAGGALARRDAWLARNAHEAVVVWDGDDARLGRQVRSLQDQLGDDVWVVDPVRVMSRCGADTGGTFTDVVFDDGRVAKLLSTPADPSRAVAAALETRPGLLAHGTTVATNALLERRGASVALITNAGFADVIEIARQDRPSLYDITADRPDPLVPRSGRLEVGGRLDATGCEVEPVDPDAVPPIPAGTEAVAICLLHADLDGRHERSVATRVRARDDVDVTCSSDVSPEFREYERMVTTVVNAYLRPACRPYVQAIDRLADEVLVMTSAGGLVPATEAAELPAALLLSGPAAGARAGALAAAAAGFPDAVTFDMGGTSTDVCLVLGGVPEPAPGRVAGGFPIRLPALDIHTIGAGGGSVARIDAGGALVVGPESAGADPGPACYGRGGIAPTVTDADLVLGRIDADATFPDLGRLDRDAAERALDRAGVGAEGVVAVVDAAMEQAARMVSVARGVDPAGLALVAFGGAGPLHACAIAEALGMAAVVVPPRAGVLSAVGLLCSPRQRDLVRSWPPASSSDGLDAALAELAARAVAAVGGRDATVTTALDCRYAGQSHELTVARPDDFHEEHRRRNGWARGDAPVEVVALRARARRPAALDMTQLGPTAVVRRATVGPSVIAEPDCTVWAPEGWRADVDEGGAWILRRSKS